MEVYENNKLQTTYHFVLDSAGKILLQYGYSSKGSLIDSLKNEYNKNGLRSKQIIFTEDVLYEFDYFENGLLKSKKRFNPNRVDPYVIEYHYKLDKSGNWISLNMITDNHVSAQFFREIKYRN